MTTATDDAVLGPNMLDLMYTSLNRQWTELGGLVGMKLSSEELANMGGTFVPQMLRSYPTKEASAKIAPQVSGLTQSQSLETGAGSFTAPICDLFIEVFDLKESNWLRRQAIVVIIQQFLGATIERCVLAFLCGVVTLNEDQKMSRRVCQCHLSTQHRATARRLPRRAVAGRRAETTYPAKNR